MIDSKYKGQFGKEVEAITPASIYTKLFQNDDLFPFDTAAKDDIASRALKSFVDTELAKKFDKTGGTVDGEINVGFTPEYSANRKIKIFDDGINSSARISLVSSSSNLTGGALEFVIDGDLQKRALIIMEDLSKGTSNKGYGIRIYVSSPNGSFNTALLIDGFGNVGVGNLSPNEKIDVFGNIKASGNFIGSGFIGPAKNLTGFKTINGANILIQDSAPENTDILFPKEIPSGKINKRLAYIDEDVVGPVDDDISGVIVTSELELATAKGVNFDINNFVTNGFLFSHVSLTGSQKPSPPNFPGFDRVEGRENLSISERQFYDGQVWLYESADQSMNIQGNYQEYTGYVLNQDTEDFSLSGRFSSGDAEDDDWIGLVIAFWIDPSTGYEYTISAIRTFNTSLANHGFSWAVYYNFRQTTQIKLIDASVSAPGTGFWTAGRNTKVSATRTGNTFQLKCSQYSTSELNVDDATIINLNLDDFLQTLKFKRRCRIGFAACSQKLAKVAQIEISGIASTIVDITNPAQYAVHVYSSSTDSYSIDGTINYKDILPTNRTAHNRITGKMFKVTEDFGIKAYSANGLIPGGAIDQLLAKASANDYDLKWVNAPTGSGSTTTDASQLTTGTLADARLSTNVIRADKTAIQSTGGAFDVNGILYSDSYIMGSDFGIFAPENSQTPLQSYWGLQLSGLTLSSPQQYTPASVGISRSDYHVVLPMKSTSASGLAVLGASGQNGNYLEITSHANRTSAANRGDIFRITGAGKIFSQNKEVQAITSGTTSERPAGVTTGFQYFDETLNQPIYKGVGGGWVDAMSGPV